MGATDAFVVWVDDGDDDELVRAVFHRFVLALLEICATHEGWANGQPTPNQKQTK